jgi:Cof subfamily protein (haloacid dehalogenase superfamily)
VSTPRLVATDLDGTLLRTDGTVSDRTARVLAEVDRLGVPVVFVTARPIRWIAPLRALVGPHGSVICSNGAVLLDLVRDEVVLTRTISAAVTLAAVRAIRAAVPAADFALEGVGGFAKEPRFRERTPMPPGSPVGPIETLVQEDDVLKLMAREETVAPDLLRAAVAGVVEGVEVTASDASGLVEISAAGVTKASTLALLCERLGVAARDVVAFGDMPNDVPMLAWAGRSFAVAGAQPAVLAVASDRAAGNDEDGVAAALETIFAI